MSVPRNGLARGQLEQKRLIRCFQLHASEEAAGQDANRPATSLAASARAFFPLRLFA